MARFDTNEGPRLDQSLYRIYTDYMRTLLAFYFLIIPINMTEAATKAKKLHRRDARKMCVEAGVYDRKGIKKCVEQKISEYRGDSKKSS